MFVPVVCKQCGLPVNHVAELFDKIRETKKEERWGKTMEALGIVNDCCKTTLMTAANFHRELWRPTHQH